MSAIESIISLVKTSSPLVATALGSPLAGIALSLLGNAFGSKSKSPDEILNLLQNDPQYALKIKQIEIDHEFELAKLASDDFKTEVSDRMNARTLEMEKEKLGIHDYTPIILAYVLTMGVFLSLLFLFLYGIPEENREIIYSIISSMMTIWVAAMSYYFGSSAGSRTKEGILKKSLLSKK